MIEIPAETYKRIVELLVLATNGDYWRVDLQVKASDIITDLIGHPGFKIEEVGE